MTRVGAWRGLAGLAAFWSAALLFCVQPMMGRLLLPRFGGSASVWVVCLVVYQTLLFLGYVYAQWLAARTERAQTWVHAGLLASALAMLLLSRAWNGRVFGIMDPGAGLGVAWRTAMAAVMAVGLPYLALSSTSTLVQSWLARLGGGEGVYRLYGASNAGSFVGLFLYPFVMDLFLPLRRQQDFWLGGFAILVPLLLVYRLGVSRCAYGPGCARISGAGIGPARRPARAGDWMAWAGLAMAGTALLVSGTAHLSVDVTPLPALWATVLGAYLLTFMLGFSATGERLLPLWCLAAVGAAVTQAASSMFVPWAPFAWSLGAGLAVVFFGAQFAHAWLYAIRPEPARLTAFYTSIAAGGAIGGILTSLLAPACLPDVWEYPVTVSGIAVLAWAYLRRHRPPQLASSSYAVAVGAVAVVLLNAGATYARSSKVVALRRDFYGVTRVEEAPIWSKSTGERGYVRVMSHGNTIHGLERVLGGRRLSPGSYYYPSCGGALALDQHPRRHDTNAVFRVGLIGLGVGELLAYARTGDRWRVYEISPEVVWLATNPALFSYVSESTAKIEIVVNDARKALEDERERSETEPFDFLFVDAYSGDSVPAHLLTREAFDLYLDRLAPDGFLALHVSNWHVDLYPLLKAIAAERGLQIRGVDGHPNPSPFLFPSSWVVMARQPFEIALPSRLASERDWTTVRNVDVMTDESGSLLRFMKPLGGAIAYARRPSMRAVMKGETPSPE